MNPEEFCKRRGILVFSSEIFKTEKTLKTLIRAFIWLQFIPILVRHDFMKNSIIYLGYSPRFKPVKEGDQIPVYGLKVTETTNKIKFSVEKAGYFDFYVDISLNS